MRKITVLLFCCLVTSTYASNFTEIETGSIKGFVLDSNTKQSLEYATITLLYAENDSVVNGTITDHSGFFKLKGVNSGNYKVKISFIGYDSNIIENVIIQPKSKVADLGKIFLSTKDEKLDEVVISADQLNVTYKLDRKVIQVDQRSVTATNTAIDLLKNSASVDVDVNGNVSLRGSTDFKVLVNDKPSVLAASDILSQIPASTIVRIEIITNPSAKYDSEGTVGIINVITNKSKLQGLSGMIQSNAGMYNNYGGDLLINYSKEKVNFYLGANATNRGIEGKLENESWNRLNDTVFYVMSNGNYNRTKGSVSARSGIDLILNSKNSVNIEGNIGNWKSDGKTSLSYSQYSSPVTLTDNYNSTEIPTRKGPFYSADINYNHQFNDKGHQLTSLFYFDQHNFIDETDNELFDLNGTKILGGKTIEKGPTKSFQFKIDYTLPLKSGNKFESGYKSEITVYDKQGELKKYNLLINDYAIDSLYTTGAKFNKGIHALYLLFNGQKNKFSYELGLRSEYTNRKIERTDTVSTYRIDRLDIFPTVHLAYNFSDNRKIMASYSRRINRPEDWQLEPFYTWNDAYNIRIGNPDLKPEYVDSYELNFINGWEANSFSIEGYYRKTINTIERVQNIFDKNVYLLIYQNSGTAYSLGTEISFNFKLFKWWSLNLNGNLYQHKVEGVLYNKNVDIESFNWNTKLYNSFKIGKTSSIRLIAYYYSPYKTVQGDNKGYFMSMFSYKQDFLQKFSAGIDITGVFGFLERSKTYQSTDFYIHNYIKPTTPIISFSISYKIKNYKYDRNQQNKNGDFDDGEGTL